MVSDAALNELWRIMENCTQANGSNHDSPSLMCIRLTLPSLGCSSQHNYLPISPENRIRFASWGAAGKLLSMVVDRVAFALVRCENPNLVLRCHPRSVREEVPKSYKQDCWRGLKSERTVYIRVALHVVRAHNKEPQKTTRMSKSCFWTQDEGCPNAGHTEDDDDDYDCKLSEWTSQSLISWVSDCFSHGSDHFWLDWWWSMRVRDTCYYMLPWLYTKYQRVAYMCLSNATGIG